MRFSREKRATRGASLPAAPACSPARPAGESGQQREKERQAREADEDPDPGPHEAEQDPDNDDRESQSDHESELEDNQALLGQLTDGVVRALAGVAGVLDAAVGHLVAAEGRRLVDHHASELELAAGPQRRLERAREDPGL